MIADDHTVARLHPAPEQRPHPRSQKQRGEPAQRGDQSQPGRVPVGVDGCAGQQITRREEMVDKTLAWADADPYVAAGVYERVDVRPFKPVLP